MKYTPFLALSGAIIIAHTLTQTWVFSFIEKTGGSVQVFPFFSLVRVWNRGITFGLLNNIPNAQWLLSGLAVAITIVMIRWLTQAERKNQRIALSLIIGGAIGNTFDRVRFGAVADYLDFFAFGYHWPAFNLTDSSIFLGVLILLLSQRTEKKNYSCFIAALLNRKNSEREGS